MTDLDYFPTSLLKYSLGVFIEPTTIIIIKSVQEGVLQNQFKKAYVKPLIEKVLSIKINKKYNSPQCHIIFINSMCNTLHSA